MSGPDVAKRADAADANARERAVVMGAMSGWWRVVDAEIESPAINAMGAVWRLYR